jgi:formylglycine-generating enzyme required for sulfatase activity
VWRDPLTYNEPYVHYYFQHPAYRNYPVVGVSYEQAVNFCKWRTKMVLKYDSLRKHPLYKKGIEYRLLSEKEWEQIADNHQMHKKDNTPNFNVKETYSLGYYNAYADIIEPVNSNLPNEWGLYNTIGNVAEMVSEKGVSKGGAWLHSIRDCATDAQISYDAPKAWLGFRCVCIVKQ